MSFLSHPTWMNTETLHTISRRPDTRAWCFSDCPAAGGLRHLRRKKKMNARQLVFSAMAITLATVTSMIKLFDMPMGGSVTLLSMLFIVLVGYWYGLGGGPDRGFCLRHPAADH